jgi:hypothetical protein
MDGVWQTLHSISRTLDSDPEACVEIGDVMLPHLVHTLLIE